MPEGLEGDLVTQWHLHKNPKWQGCWTQKVFAGWCLSRDMGVVPLSTYLILCISENVNDSHTTLRLNSFLASQWVPADPLLIHLCVNAPEKADRNGLSAAAPASTGETQVELLDLFYPSPMAAQAFWDWVSRRKVSPCLSLPRYHHFVTLPPK